MGFLLVGPGAYEAASKATASAEADNEKAFENIAGAKEKQGLIDTDDYKAFAQRLQNPLIKEYTLKHIRNPNMI